MHPHPDLALELGETLRRDLHDRRRGRPGERARCAKPYAWTQKSAKHARTGPDCQFVAARQAATNARKHGGHKQTG